MGLIIPNFAQTFDLRFTLSEVDCATDIACYDVQVRSVNGSAFNLAGQNYRIYYDNNLVDFQSGTSELSPSSYGSFVLVQDVGPADASTFSSNLGFESSIGFLNYQIDLNELANGGITIPANGDWVTTSNLCFDVSSSIIENASECIELVWAKDGYTNDLATAFNEISQWVAPNDTDPVTPSFNATHDNLDSSDGDESCFDISCPAANTNAMFDISTNIESVDCTNNEVCFSVNLKSSNGTDFGLAGQNYRLYYNNLAGDFKSGMSLLPSAYGSFNLVADNGPVNASASSSNLGFEQNLGFLNYSMDLNDIQNGGLILNNNWITTSILCFEVSDEVLYNDDDCFDAIWARDGLTNNLATAFVEVSEWVSSSNTTAAEGVNYTDLNDQNSCSFNSCIQPDISINDVQFDETSGMVQSMVCLSAPHSFDITLDYNFVDDSATRGIDYTGVDGQLIIPAGSLCGDINYTIIDDNLPEMNEAFYLTIWNPSYGQIVDGMAQIEILDNDLQCEAEAPQIISNN